MPPERPLVDTPCLQTWMRRSPGWIQLLYREAEGHNRPHMLTVARTTPILLGRASCPHAYQQGMLLHVLHPVQAFQAQASAFFALML